MGRIEEFQIGFNYLSENMQLKCSLCGKVIEVEYVYPLKLQELIKSAEQHRCEVPTSNFIPHLHPLPGEHYAPRADKDSPL